MRERHPGTCDCHRCSGTVYELGGEKLVIESTYGGDYTRVEKPRKALPAAVNEADALYRARENEREAARKARKERMELIELADQADLVEEARKDLDAIQRVGKFLLFAFALSLAALIAGVFAGQAVMIIGGIGMAITGLCLGGWAKASSETTDKHTSAKLKYSRMQRRMGIDD